MKVSVIVPTYRRDRHLYRALNSLILQKYGEIEIIVVDDNDDLDWNRIVERIVSDCGDNNPKIQIKYIQNHPNQGSAKSRNIGIDVSTGEYVTFLDDDDIYLPDKVSTQVEFMDRGYFDYSVTDLALYYDNEKLSEHRTREYIKNTHPDVLLKYHFMYHITGTDTMMFKTEYLRKIGGFVPIDSGDEFYLMQRAIESGGTFGYLARCDVKAYVHTNDGGLSIGQGKIDGENHLYEYKKKFFYLFNKKEQNFIKMRHYAVLAFAFLRMKKYGLFVKNGLFSFLCSPIKCFQLLTYR